MDTRGQRTRYKSIEDVTVFSPDDKQQDSSLQSVGNLRPRYHEKTLIKQFTLTLVSPTQRGINETPLEYYESALYSCSRHWAEHLQGKTITIEPIDLLHHICRLKENEGLLEESRLQELNYNLEKVIFEHPSAFEEYKLIVSLLEVFSGLVVKWGILVPENYQYRIRGRTMVLKILNLTLLSTTVFSIDTLWLSTMVNIPPFSKLMEEAVRQYGIVMVQEFRRIVNYALRLNPINLREENNVAGYLAARIPYLRTEKHIEPDYVCKSVYYQELSLPTGVLKKCRKHKSSAAVSRLRQMLTDFEMLYRAFEIAVVRSLMVYSNC